MLKTNLVCLMISTLFLLSTALSGGILETYTYGEPSYTSSARYLGMGETFIAGDITANPSSFASFEGTLVSIGFESSLQGERRSKKAFDSFDNTIGDVTISDNSFVYLEPTPLVIAHSFKFANIAFQIMPKYKMDYTYERTVRDEFYVKILDIEERSEGNLWAYSGVIAKKFGQFGAGVRVDYINGSVKYENNRYYVDPEIGPYERSYKSDWEGWDFSLGLNVDVNWRLRLALFYDMGANLDKTNPFYLELMPSPAIFPVLIYPGPVNKIDYPAVLGLGIRLRPVNQLPATLNLDVIYTNWENLDYESPFIYPSYLDSTNTLNSVFSYHLGVEHLFSPETKLSFGFAYTPSYIDRSIATAEFTLGGGFLLSGFEIDIGAGISRRVYKGSDVPVDLESGVQVDIEDELSFEELGVKILTTITKHF